MTTNKLIFALETAIEETKNALELQYTGIDVIKNQARDILTSVNFIATLVVLLKINDMTYNFNQPNIKEICVLIAGFSYIVIMSINIYILSITTVKTPMKINWEVFEKLYFKNDPKKVLENKLENYIDAHEQNEAILNIRKRLSSISVFSYSVLVLSLLILIFYN